MMDVPPEVLISLGVSLYLLGKKHKNLKKRKWTKRWLTCRKLSSKNILHELALHEPNDYKNYLRMDESLFQELLAKVRNRIERRNTVMRNAIPAEQRLAATLRYLATGNTYEDLKFSTGISP